MGNTIKNLGIRLIVVAIISVFVSLLFFGLSSAVSGMLRVNAIMTAPIVDLPKTIQTCPSDMTLDKREETRPNYNRTGYIMNVRAFAQAG